MREIQAPVVNPLGLHARAAARFVHLAGQYVSHIEVGRGSRTVDGKSILGLLMLAAARGTTIMIRATGADEDAAVDALTAFTARGFDDPV
jgi:phosphocarrier protein HPr